MKKGLLLLAATIIATGMLFGAGQQDGAEATTLTLLHNQSGAATWQPYFDQMAEEIKAETGYDLESTTFPTTDIYSAQIRSSLITKDAPSLFIWWSTYRMEELANQNVLTDLSAVWDRHKDEYTEDTRNAFTFNGEVYGFPINTEYWVVWYNKEVYAELGLTPPETWDEFIEICDTLVDNDITPLLSTINGRWPSFIMFEELIVGQDPDLYVDLCEGRANYSDPRVRAAFELWAEMINKGYFTDPSTDVWAGGARDFNQKKVGMAIFGTWYMSSNLLANGVPEENIGAFILPSHNPKAGKNVIQEIKPILVSKNAPNQEAIAEVVDFWMSPEGNYAFSSQLKGFPANQKADASYLPEVKVDLFNQITDGYRILNRYWEATPTPICEAAVDQFAKFMLDPSSIDEVLAELDKVADDYWSSK